MKRSNCLIFAILEHVKNGKYIVIRKTRNNHRWPCCRYHFLVVPPEVVEKYAESFVPVGDDEKNFPPPLFKGKIRKGD